MDFGGCGLKTAAVAIVAAGAATLAAIPAEAASIKLGDKLNISGDSRLEINGNTAILNFGDDINGDEVDYSTGFGQAQVSNTSALVFRLSSDGVTVEPRATRIATLTDLSLISDGPNVWRLGAAVNDFIVLGYNGISFNLTSFVLTQTGSKWVADYTGFFAGSLPGIGEFSTQGNFASVQGSTFSSSVEAVPTPALLPGLVGMGLAALRKRDEEEQESAV